MKIGIIGYGVVGRAVAEATKGKGKYTLAIYDKYQTKDNVGDVSQTDICFVSVPTPTSADGVQDQSSLFDVAHSLDGKFKGILVIKCTVLPGTMDALAKTFPNLRLVHYPEFLSEKTAGLDFKKQPCVLLSGKSGDTDIVNDFLSSILPDNFYFIETSENFLVTEYAKYIHNIILPIKLSALNEIHALCGPKIYQRAAEMAEHFGNLGSRYMVPGHDGKPGWGGMCFVKDTIAFSKFARNKGVLAHTLDGAIETNRKIRQSAYDGKEKTGISTSNMKENL